MLPSTSELISFIFNRYPELKGESFRAISNSMQNAVIIVGERLVFRFPLSSDTSSLEMDKQFLPLLAPMDDDEPFISYPLIPGEPLIDGFFSSNGLHQ